MSVRPDLVALHTVQRLRRPDGEFRANLLRLVVVAAFYAVHLANVFLFDLPTGRTLAFGTTQIGVFDLGATVTAGAWTAVASAVLLVGRDPREAWVGVFSTAVDLFLLSTLVVVAGGPRTPLVMAYPLVVAGAGLRGSVLHVAATTAGALASYAAIGAGTHLLAPQVAPPTTTLLVTATAIGGTGVVVAQLVASTSRALEQQATLLARLWSTGAGVALPTGPVTLVVPTGASCCPWCSASFAGAPLRCEGCDQPLSPDEPFHTAAAQGPRPSSESAWLGGGMLLAAVFSMLSVWLVLRLPVALPPLFLVGLGVGAALVRTAQEVAESTKGDPSAGALVTALGRDAGPRVRAVAQGFQVVVLGTVLLYLSLIVTGVMAFALCTSMVAGFYLTS